MYVVQLSHNVQYNTTNHKAIYHDSEERSLKPAREIRYHMTVHALIYLSNLLPPRTIWGVSNDSGWVCKQIDK